ncbi:MAG: urease accessory protein UreD [Rhodobacteraceae bacterium]|nr:urease accessory protein UreD [Paracoccaceae bacterium]
MNALGGISLGARPVSAALHFRALGGRTYLARQFTPHPFHITRPFYHPGDPAGMATLYLQSSSGGVYSGDDLSLDIRVEAEAQVHVTTQASTIVHDARGRTGVTQTVSLNVAEGARLDYLPDPAILMTGSKLCNRVTATLGRQARVILGDAQLCHDPEGRARPFSWIENEIELIGPGGTDLLDRFELSGTEWPARTGGFACSGMMIVAGYADAGAAMQRAADNVPGIYAGLSVFSDRNIALIRFLAPDGAALSKVMTATWHAAATALDGHPPAERRK